MNKVILRGRLTKDCELGFLPNTGTPKITFTLAVDRAYQKDKENKKTDFIHCELLGKRAESLSPYCLKGKELLVMGELNIDNYEKNGDKKSFTKVALDTVEFIGAAKKEQQENEFNAIDDDDCPF